MSTKLMTCIACPQGCQLVVEYGDKYLIKLTGHKCPKGAAYAKQEIENPLRTVTSTVRAFGQPLKMIPVRTQKPIPKDHVFAALAEIKKIKINAPVVQHQVLVTNFLGLGVDLITTRGSE